ncbi:radical SAM protein [Bacillus cereus]|uniref:radical SAM protein n=1 Tax=Bacillus cereus TaxID=1396 RepID=UPI003302F9C2|nr:radical SAM protein [Bacillus cereus]
MTLEVRPLGVACNLACQYCYQNPMRDAGNISKNYDIDKIKLEIVKQGDSFVLFGGEPLLIDETDLESLWSWGYEKFGMNGMQTNGVLINNNHIRMFKQYRVHVGVSIDGPGELNDVRWFGSLEKTRGTTARTEQAIERLCQEGIPPSLIITLHRLNATEDKLPIMHEWIKKLESLGVTSVRLHILETESEVIKQKYGLTPEENIHALLSFNALELKLQRLKFDIFRDMENLLLGQDKYSTCVWRGCDPYATTAVKGVEGNGQSSNCGRTNKSGIDFTKADQSGYERYIALYHTPQEYGGCKGCRFFLMCKGQCPGTAIDNEWRNRTQDCEVWKQLFISIENRFMESGYQTISLHPNLKYLELEMLKSWEQGMNPTLQETMEWMRKKTEEGNKKDVIH